MNCFSVILAVILAITLVQGNDEEIQKIKENMEGATKAFCDKQITDDQLAELTQKCKGENDDLFRTIAKNCLKVDEITDRQRVDIVCNKEHQDCLTEGWKQHFATLKPEQVQEITKGFQERLACVKTVLKIE